jgi:uncharacterized integral membrane protein (TIGR00698 family)
MENTPLQKILTLLPGLGLAVLIAGIAHLLSFGYIALDPLILSMLISIILGNLLGPRERLDPGVSLSHRIFIPLGIVLYGTQMDYEPLRLLGGGRIAHVLLMVIFTLAVVYWISVKLGVSRKTGLLLAAGTAICGASAIMVLSPVIKAEKEDTSVALLAITIVGLAGVIVYPLVQESLSLTEETYGLLCGTTLYMMGQVKAAAGLLGANALEIAVPVKLIRIGTLLPIALVFSFLIGRKERKIYVPWFIVGSFVLSLLTVFTPSLAEQRAAIAPAITFLFSIAIAGIGLTVDLEAIIDAGPKPLLAVFMGWIILIGLFMVGLGVLEPRA